MALRQSRILTEGAPAPDIPGVPAGKAALVVFFKITCPVCQLTLPYLNRLHQAGTLAVYGVSQNEPDDTREFIDEFQIEFPVVYDSEEAGYPASNEYRISSVPTMFLIGADGRITSAMEGWNKKDMERLGVVRADDNVPEWKAG
ncbi:MAG TPA: TlpA disulfide reductase family protein [Candidatus Sulfopaludibacter sp.]|jgi:peroxiredoxin|nr:TlpA disulfide reductase family protein [Candidatus Sulfopaludibacter sp.]